MEGNPSRAQGDAATIRQVESGLFRAAKGEERFRAGVPVLIRQAIDEVIDSKRSGRYVLRELEKTEKTYLGTKVEILLRNFLKLKRGAILDLEIGGIEVDIKHTIGATWAIPREAMSHPCILLREDEDAALCWAGLLVIRDAYLTPGANQDGKRNVSSFGKDQIHWILAGVPYPKNFWESHMEILETLRPFSSGTQRLAEFFRLVQNTPVPRSVIEAVAPQKDSLKRLRKNGGARDRLRLEGIALLWGKNDRKLIEELGLPECSNSEFISYRPATEASRALLREAGRLS